MATFNGSTSDILSTIDENEDGSMIVSASSTVPSSNSTSSSLPENNLTIHRKWKIEVELEKNADSKTNPSKSVPVIKMLATVAIGALLLFCTLAAKYSILKVSHQLSHNIILQISTERVQNIRYFLVIFFMLLCPYVFNCLRALWIGGLRKDMPWPSKKEVLWALVSSTCECFGLCLFVYKIFVTYSLITGQLLLNTIFVLPTFINLLRCYQGRAVFRKRYWIPYVISAIASFSGTVCTFVVVAEHKSNGAYIWHVVIATLTLTVAWSHDAAGVVHQILVGRQQEKPAYQSFSNSDPLPNTDNFTTSSGFVSEEDDEEGREKSSVNYNIRADISELSTFWKLGMISNTFKLCLIFIFSFLVYFVDNEIYPSNLRFTNIMYDEFVKAWKMPWDEDSQTLVINLAASVVGYGTAFFACRVCMRKGAFAIPLIASILVSPIVLMINSSCVSLFSPGRNSDACDSNGQLPLVITSTVLMIISVTLMALGLFTEETTVLQKESKLFVSPSFNGIVLDQWLLLNHKTEILGGDEYRKSVKGTRVYICTTMYRETSEEMKELLDSIHRVNMSQMEGYRFFESHIIFDDGIKNRSPSRFAYQLMVLVYPTLGVKPEDCTKVLTPYGMKFSWRLPSTRGSREMTFHIHLKDNFKVKNKKRWSQIMYMSFVLDFLMRDVSGDQESFILTTDADVNFTSASVEALLDLMIRDSSVGAVCARTHPTGSGPLVWYQVFDYAIGHWFQKATEHVLGSVLCSPGCFSVYRCSAIKDILPRYATRVEHADDFLIKDMGEDRWLCTLLVQSGWRIEYCAAAQNSTNCPMEFEEFFKQRRRWMASTMANMMLILKKWYIINRFNHRVSLLFILYQGILLVSTLIGPSTVILIISGGLLYAWSISPVVSVILQLVVAIMFVMMCVLAPARVQIVTAKILTFVYAIIMSVVAIGIVQKTVEDLGRAGNTSTDSLTVKAQLLGSGVMLPVDITTLYFIGLIGLFTITGLAHPSEFLCLFHGIWYLLCLPAGYIILTLYSICNITDRSWGTREARVHSVGSHESWYNVLSRAWRLIFFCCDKSNIEVIKASGVVDLLDETVKQAAAAPAKDVVSGTEDREESQASTDDNIFSSKHVQEWLPQDLKEMYLHLFIEQGYDNTLFISCMTKTDLEKMGIKNKSHIQYLIEEIKSLPAFEIEFEVPISVEAWLESIGLEMYKSNFQKCKIRKPTHMQILKCYNEKEIQEQLSIYKPGHVKRLIYAISKLRNPTKDERKLNAVKALIENSPIHQLRESNAGEDAFWRSLIDQCLTPGGEAFSIEVELQVELNNLRTWWLMILAVSNTLWLILISTLATKVDLSILGVNPLSLAFLVVFSIVFSIQFLCMLVHRFQTVTHFLARAPYKCGKHFNSNWTFQDTYMGSVDIEDSSDLTAINSVRDASIRARARQKQQKRRRQESNSHYKNIPDETTTLL